LNSLFFFNCFQSRFLPFPLDLFQNSLGLLELLLDLALALGVADRGLFGNSRFRFNSHGLQLLGDLALLPGDGAHRFKFFGDGLGAPSLHFLFFCLHLCW